MRDSRSRADGSAAAGLTPQNSLGWKTTEVLRALFARAKPEVEHDADNPERINSAIGSRPRNSCVRLMQDLNLNDERARYLTMAQHEACDAAFTREAMKLNEKIVGMKLPIPNSPYFGERPFLPTVDCIPADERSEIGRRLAVLLCEGKLSRLRLREALRDGFVQAVIEPTTTGPSVLAVF
jgi:hypothetical protein